MPTDPQEETLRFLASLDGGGEIARTHISRVVLGRARAFKLKRAVAFPYLDFSTPQKRLAMCEREVMLNRRTAPELYLGARRVTRTRDGGLELDGGGELVDAIVEMRRFDGDDLLESMAATGRLTGQIVETLARRIASFHDSAEIVRERGGYAAMLHILELNEVSERRAPPAPPDAVRAHDAQLRARLDEMKALLDARHAQGKTRLCHGDLTLRNICLLEGVPTPFDCLEFSDELASIDVLYDLAFLLMDLCRVGKGALANLALNRYLDWRDEIDGLRLLPFFMSMRATIRAYVAAQQQSPEEASAYFDLSRALIGDCAPFVIAIGGYSGSGKSSIAAELAPLIGAAPGARTLNSDRLRKKLFGAEPTERLPTEAYTGEVSERVYARMFEEAARVVAASWPVVVDAMFDLPQSRAEIEQVAKDAGVPFHGFWLDADIGARLARVDIRQNDPSDATREVLLRQMQRGPGAIGWTQIDASRGLEVIVKEIARFIRASLLAAPC
jgi:aminoglycoside phosphotransferase family enzyme/predicted kinase